MPEHPQRLHVAAAVGEAFRGLGDLALPLIIGLVAGGTRGSGSALVFGVVGVAAALVLGVARWWRTTYRVAGGALQVRSGVFSPDETVVPLERIQAVDTITGPIQRLFGVTGLHVQTPGGGEDGDVVLPALSARAAARLRGALGHPDHGLAGARRRLTPRGLLATALTAPQLGVLLPVVGGVFGLLQNGLLGAGEAAVRDVGSLHEVVLVVAALLAVAWLLSIAGAVVAFAGFEVQRVEERLRIRRGLLQRRAVSVPVGRIDGLQVVESLPRRPFGLVTLRLEVTSLGGREAAARTLFPLLRRAEVEPFLQALLPELAGPLAPQLRPPARARRRYLTRPLAAAAVAGGAVLAAAPAAWPVVPVLVIAAVLSGLDAYAAGGLRLAGGADRRIVVRGRRRGARVTLVARRHRLQRLEVARSPLQRRAGLATVSIAVAGGTRLGVRHVERALAARVLAEAPA
jgi:putative membrane protein